MQFFLFFFFIESLFIELFDIYFFLFFILLLILSILISFFVIDKLLIFKSDNIFNIIGKESFIFNSFYLLYVIKEKFDLDLNNL